MPDRHLTHPITWRPSPAQRARLESFAARSDRKLREVIAAAVDDYLAEHDAASRLPEVIEFNRTARRIE